MAGTYTHSNSFKRISLPLVVVVVVLLLRLFNPLYNVWASAQAPRIGYIGFSVLHVLYYLVPVVLTLLCFHHPKHLLRELGLRQPFATGILIGCACTLPMLVGYGIMGAYREERPVYEALTAAIRDGFREEIFYRAFLFGQLFRVARWGFLPAVLVNAAIFGASHLYQAQDLMGSFGVFAVTFGGAVWFAWLFIEWEENLWVPIVLHVLMNFYWDVFSTNATALGGWWLNGPRAVTIGLSVWLTIRHIRKRGKAGVNRGNLLIN